MIAVGTGRAVAAVKCASVVSVAIAVRRRWPSDVMEGFVDDGRSEPAKDPELNRLVVLGSPEEIFLHQEPVRDQNDERRSCVGESLELFVGEVVF